MLAGRYRLDSVIGKGSMGTVWAATDQILHRQVAIKEIDFPPGTPPGERAQLEARTLREARAIAALSNPYVITLFDILTLEQGPVIVMELLRARSLAEILRQVGRLPDGQAATIGVAVASGLIAAHAAGITHRDVKPGNVLVCDDGRIKLTDFGIARSSAEQTMTATGLLLGSPAYIAPEVANGVPVGPVSDAWSLGGLLFATVEGRPPFDQGTAIATLTSVVKDPVPPHPHSGRLGAVVSGLLVKTPALRMRLDRALVIMRNVADDPSGMNLAAVSRIPRVEDTAPGIPPIIDATGSGSARAGGTASHSRPSATSAQLRATARPPLPPRSDPSLPPGSAAPIAEQSLPPDRSSTPPGPGTPPHAAATQSRPEDEATGAGSGRRGTQPWVSGPNRTSAAQASSPGVLHPEQGWSAASQAIPTRSASPSSAASSPAQALSTPPQPSPTQSAASQSTPPPSTPPQSTPSQSGPSQPAQASSAGPQFAASQSDQQVTRSRSQSQSSQPPFRPPSGSADSAARDSRQIPLAALQHALPPPPWAPEDAAGLPPLPVDPAVDQQEKPSAAGHSTLVRLIAAALVAILAAVLGFLGVRIIADLASQSASAAGAWSSSANPSSGTRSSAILSSTTLSSTTLSRVIPSSATLSNGTVTAGEPTGQQQSV